MSKLTWSIRKYEVSSLKYIYCSENCFRPIHFVLIYVKKIQLIFPRYEKFYIIYGFFRLEKLVFSILVFYENKREKFCILQKKTKILVIWNFLCFMKYIVICYIIFTLIFLYHQHKRLNCINVINKWKDINFVLYNKIEIQLIIFLLKYKIKKSWACFFINTAVKIKGRKNLN